MLAKKVGIIGLTGIILLNPLAVIAMSTEYSVPVVSPAIINQNDQVVSEGIDKTTQLVVQDGQVSLTKNPDSVGEVTTLEIAESLASIVGLKEESSNIETTSDSENAIIVETEGSSLYIPRDSSEAIVMESEGVALEITLPEVENASEATQIANGVVAYASQSDFANAVQATENGVRMTTVIDNPNAPTEYTYEVTLPEGGYIEVVEEGHALVYNNVGIVILFVDTPWAKDANGNDVETYFTTDGQSLTQVVKHNVAGVVYPVTADPWWAGTCQSYVNSVRSLQRGGQFSYTISVEPSACGRANAHRNQDRAFHEVLNKYRWFSGNQYWSLRHQYVCHAIHPAARYAKPRWNLEPARPNVGITRTYNATCNPS